jgi:hypothetical protein
MQEISAFVQKKPPVETELRKPEPMPAFYTKGKSVGSTGATLDLSRILEYVLKDEQTFSYLPKNLQAGLRKVYKMTQDPTKYASEETASDDKEAFLGLGGPAAQLRGLKDYLAKALTGKELPKPVLDALLDAHGVVEKELSAQGGSAAVPGARQQRRDEQEDKKREDVIRKHTEREDVGKREDTAIDRLKKMFQGSKHYVDVFRAVPYEIRQELQKLSLDPENLKYLSSQRAVFASRAVVKKYLGAR